MHAAEFTGPKWIDYNPAGWLRSPVMKTKCFTLIFVIGFAGACIAQAQSPTPTASPKVKHARTKTAASPTASPSPAKPKLGDLFKPKSSAAASPAAASRAPAKSASAETATNPPAPGGGHGLVWVNTESHVYHREGSHFYGTTKKGKYMTEAEAIKEGNKAAAKGP
jgi:hypothetical protein